MPGTYCGLAVALAAFAMLAPAAARSLALTRSGIERWVLFLIFAGLLGGAVAASLWIGADLRAACIECASPTGKGLVLRGYPSPPPAHDPLKAHMLMLLICIVACAIMLYRLIARPRRANAMGGLAGMISPIFAVLAFVPSLPSEGDAGVFIYLIIAPAFMVLQVLLLFLSLGLLIRTLVAWTPASPPASPGMAT